MSVIKLQPDETSGIDTYIYHGGGLDDTNYGTETVLTVKTFDVNNLSRILIKFDLSSIPTNATIISATLGLYSEGGAAPTGTYDIGVYPITRTWTEGGATWNKYDGSNTWTTAGGDFDSTAIDTVSVDNTPALKMWTITPSIVHGWFTTNNGLLLKGTNESNSIADKYFTSSSGTAANRPYLEITYSVPSTGYSFFM